MKVLLALAVLASSTAFAASDIYDIQYLPAAGTTYGFTTLEMSKQTQEFSGGAETEISGWTVNQTVGHALTDRLSVQLELDYADLEDNTDGAARKTEISGISDPTVSARWRLMDETSRWDILGGATFGIQDREVESNGDVNNVQGGHDLFVGTQYGQKSDSFQWAVTGLLTHNLAAETDNNGVDVENDAYNSLLVRADFLNKLAEKSFVRYFAAADFAEEFEDDQTPAQTTASATTYTLGAEYQHLMSQDLLLRAGLNYDMTNSSTGQTDSDKTLTWVVGANYQF